MIDLFIGLCFGLASAAAVLIMWRMAERLRKELQRDDQRDDTPADRDDAVPDRRNR